MKIAAPKGGRLGQRADRAHSQHTASASGTHRVTGLPVPTLTRALDYLDNCGLCASLDRTTTPSLPCSAVVAVTTTDQPSLFDDLFEHREFHPITQRLLPLVPTDEQVIDGIAESIIRVGLINPITLHPDGRIIDGRLRYLACQQAGVEPSYTTLGSYYTEPMILDFLVSNNLRRSHLNPDQRAMIRADYQARRGAAAGRRSP